LTKKGKKPEAATGGDTEGGASKPSTPRPSNLKKSGAPCQESILPERDCSRRTLRPNTKGEKKKGGGKGRKKGNFYGGKITVQWGRGLPGQISREYSWGKGRGFGGGKVLRGLQGKRRKERFEGFLQKRIF